ncbi:unnamed protein product, partial [Ascophyllum nodosum]
RGVIEQVFAAVQKNLSDVTVDRTSGAETDVGGDAAMSTPRPQQLASSPPVEERLSISGQPSRYSRHEAASPTGSGSESGVDPP